MLGTGRREGKAGAFLLGSGVNIIDYGILFGRIKIEGPVHDAPKIDDAVFGLGGKYFWESPAGGQQAGEVGFFEVHDLVAEAVIDDGAGGLIGAAPVIDQVVF